MKISILTLLSTIVFIGFSFGQSIGSFGNSYVHSAAEVGVHGKMMFNNNGTGVYPGIIVTSRNSQNPGVISFGENASWENAGDSKHVDGFVKVYSDMAFTFPVGDLGLYKPLSISGAAGTMVAYSYDNPSKLSYINSTVATRAAEEEATNLIVSDLEYWDVRGNNPTKITLTWDTNSSLEQLANDDLSNLTIVGWDGNSWTVISSSVDDNVLGTNDSSSDFTKRQSTVNNGSITTNDEIVPDDYSVITFGVITNVLVENTTPEYGSELVNNETIEFTLFPNPSADLNQINIDYDLTEVNSEVSLMIFNALGERIYEMKMDNNKSIIRLPYQNNTSGIYHVGIITSNGSKVFKPVVITQ